MADVCACGHLACLHIPRDGRCTGASCDCRAITQHAAGEAYRADNPHDAPRPPLSCDRSPDPTLRCEFVAGHNGMHQADGHWWGSSRRATETGDLGPLIEGIPAPAPADPLTEARVAESIAAARANQAFMNRLAERIEQDRGLLDRLAEFPPTLAVQGSDKPAGNSTERHPYFPEPGGIACKYPMPGTPGLTSDTVPCNYWPDHPIHAPAAADPDSGTAEAGR